MKYERVFVVSLLCISLVSTTLLSAWTLSRMYTAYNIAREYAAVVKPPAGVTSSTNLTLTIYADPEPGRQILNMFQYVTAQNIQWRTTTTDQMGNSINIDFNLGSVLFQKLSEDNFVGTATGLNIRASLSDVFNIFAKADNVNVDLLFWRYADMPALNATGVLTGNVEISLFASVLPLPGLSQVLYEYKGDQYIIKFCIIKPMEVTIEQPSSGAVVRGDVNVQALVKHAPEITVDNVFAWTPNENIPMHYNAMNGRWEGVWQSYNVGNGKAGIGVRAEGFEPEPGAPQYRYSDQKWIDVEVSNPWVQSFVLRNGGWLEGFGGLMVNLQYGQTSWQRGTGFNFWPWIGLSMTAPEYWWNGNIRFNSWRIDDESGNTIFQSWEQTLTITEDIFGMLFDREGRARELKCIYVPVQS